MRNERNEGLGVRVRQYIKIYQYILNSVNIPVYAKLTLLGQKSARGRTTNVQYHDISEHFCKALSKQQTVHSPPTIGIWAQFAKTMHLRKACLYTHILLYLLVS
jgi:hypothetical protein